MPAIQPFPGMPGVGAEKTARHRRVGADGYFDFLPAGVILDGAKARDPDNPDYAADGIAAQRRLRGGLLIGKATSGGKYANSVLGVLQAAVSATGTSVTLTPAQAVELVRRIGPTGTLRLVGPPTAGGTVATWTELYTAVNTSTGVVTVSALDADLVAGSFVAANDGTHTPMSFLSDGWELIVPEDGSDLPLAHLPVRGLAIEDQLLPWPADASLRAWVRASLNAAGGLFQFTTT